MFADFVIIAFATPFVVLVLAGYGLLAAALVGNLHEKLTPAFSNAGGQAAAKS